MKTRRRPCISRASSLYEHVPRLEVVVHRASVQLTQRNAQVENAIHRLDEARRLVEVLRESVEACRIHARRPGLVVYEEHLAGNPRRKVRVDDRVTASQGLVTIPEVARMFIDTSIREADVHRVRPGQAAVIRVEAFPDSRLSGTVVSVGALAQGARARPLEDKRFDLTVEVSSAPPELRPEMSVRIDILVAQRADVLLVPANAVFEHNGVWVAHVIRGWRTETRPVQLGESHGWPGPRRSR